MMYLLAVLLSLLPCCGVCESLSDGISSVIGSLDITALEQDPTVESALAATGGFRETLTAIARGEITLSFDDMLGMLANAFFGCLRQSTGRLAMLAAPVMLWSVFRRLADGTAKTGKAACSLTVCVVLAQDLSEHAVLCRETILQMADTMQGLFPLLLTLMTAVGSSGASALMQPAVVAAAGSMTAIIGNVTLPLAMVAAMLIMLTLLWRSRRHPGRLAYALLFSLPY